MTVLRLVALREPEAFADWYRLGADYVLDVAGGLDLTVGDGGDLHDLRGRVDDAAAALARGETALDPASARTVAAVLLGDAAYSEPFCEWMPLWYELLLLPGSRYAGWRLRRVARRVAADSGLDHVSSPRYSRPSDVLVRGRPAVAFVDGFAAQFRFAAAITHLEWFLHAAPAFDVRVPADLAARAREETVRRYALGESLSPRVREFQRLLFGDDEWVRAIDEAYGLDSVLFDRWERILRRERERLEATRTD